MSRTTTILATAMVWLTGVAAAAMAATSPPPANGPALITEIATSYNTWATQSTSKWVSSIDDYLHHGKPALAAGVHTGADKLLNRSDAHDCDWVDYRVKIWGTSAKNYGNYALAQQIEAAGKNAKAQIHRSRDASLVAIDAAMRN